MKIKFLLLSCLFICSSISAQLQFFSQDAWNGYTLFLGDKLYLVNNCGEQVHSWSAVVPKYHVKLLPNGNIVYIDWGTHSIVERDWDDNLVSQTFPINFDLKFDYEVIVLENGNYLSVGRLDYSTTEFTEIGYDVNSFGTPFHVDVVVEVVPNTGEIVWQWNIAEHAIQERSDTEPNFGIIKDHPELLDVDAISNLDWVQEESWMINGMDYNADLDQIALSVRKMSEIIIIDHSTTTAEAAGHTGGNSGKGGDILYRWGNPANYHRGLPDDRELFYQHNPNWIEYGEHAGKIAIFNNGLYRPGVSFNDQYSNAPIIETSIQSDGTYSIGQNLPFTPNNPNVNYGGLPNSPLHFYSNYTSGTKVLPNGNVLITIGDDNRVIELKPDGTLVWEYQLPTAAFTFRVEKYAPDYPAFDGKNLMPQGTIESPSSTVPCEIIVNTNSIFEKNLNAWVDTESHQLFLQTEIGENYDAVIFDLLGKKIQSFNIENERSGNGNGEYQFLLSEKINGVFLLTLINKKTGELNSKKLFLQK